MPITRPTLPPRAGYVEVEDENGNRIYKPTAETEEKLRLEAENKQLQQQVQDISETNSVYDELAAAYQEGVDQA